MLGLVLLGTVWNVGLGIAAICCSVNALNQRLHSVQSGPSPVSSTAFSRPRKRINSMVLVSTNRERGWVFTSLRRSISRDSMPNLESSKAPVRPIGPQPMMHTGTLIWVIWG